MNIFNGGLITKFNDNFYITDLKDYSGTLVLSEDFRLVNQSNALMWFANVVEDKIYYSNQKDKNYIYCLDVYDQNDFLLIDKPCFNLVYYEGELYFIQEEDDFLYKYNLATKKIMKIINEPVILFVIFADILYFSTIDGLKKLQMNNNQVYEISKDVPIRLIFIDDMLIYSDKSSDYALTIFNLQNNERKQLNDVRTKSITYKDGFIYISNIENNLSIERIDVLTDDKIRLCGEKSDMLHIVDDYLFFINKNSSNAWFKLHLIDFSITHAIDTSFY